MRKKSSISLFFLLLMILLCPLSIYGQEDDTHALQELADRTWAKGQTLYLENRVYNVKRLIIKGSITGKSGTTIKRINRGNPYDKYNFCRIDGGKKIELSNIIFDGSNSNSNDKTGAIPLSVVRAEGVKIENCKFSNSFLSGLRIAYSTDIHVENCSSTNNYGIFGDGYYVENSNSITFINCNANNYNRIGFVLDNNVENVTFQGCKATNGNNASILVGGTEYNAGFWFEKAGNIHVNNCTASNNSHYGFLAVSGLEKHGNNVSFSFEDCVAFGNKTGFKVGSLGKNAVEVNLVRCKTHTVDVGIEVTCKNYKDKYAFNGCEIGYNVSSRYGIGVNYHNKFTNSGKSNLKIDNSVFVYPGGQPSRYSNSASSYSSDIYVNNVNRVDVNLTNTKNSAKSKLTFKSPTSDNNVTKKLESNSRIIKSLR